MSARVEFLVEEPSITPYIDATIIAARPELAYSVREFNGKQDLLRKVPQRLHGYSRYENRPQIVILVDQDREDCHDLKRCLEDMAINAGLSTKSSVGPGVRFDVCIRIVVRELEAWALGDEGALLNAFPRVAPFAGKKKFRIPDDLDKPSKELERLLQRYGYYAAGLAKLDFAERIAGHLEPSSSRSPSFRAFSDLLPELGDQA